MWLRNNTSAHAAVRHISAPAPTMYFSARLNGMAWIEHPDDPVEAGQRITLEEAAAFQSFRPDYAWCGTRSERFQQVGNAAPPLFVAACARALGPEGVVADGVELFAGGGGLAEGLRLVAPDLHVVGLEWDHAACRTRVANGHLTIRTDVATYPTKPFRGVRLVAGGPPCQTFAMSGPGDGRRHIAAVAAAASLVAGGLDPAEALAKVQDEALDFRTMLVLQPLRWVRDLLPSCVLLEQVPPVLPVWQAVGSALTRLGYHVWTGNLHAEEYGVGQARTRALLLASAERPVDRPPPTHRRYSYRKPGGGRYADECGELDDGRLPWVSMADVLAHGMTDRPCVSVMARTTDENGRGTGGARSLDGGSRARAVLAREHDAGRWMGPPGSAVTVDETAVLQSFRPGLVWCGTEAQRRQQIGNAVPPLLAAHAAATVLGLPVPKLETPRLPS